MNPFEMVAIIVVVSVIGGIVSSHYKSKEKAAARPAAPDEATTARISALEERVRVLERIMTDKRQRLSDEIDNL